MFIKNPYVNLLQNWPLLTQVPSKTYQKRAFSETPFLLGFTFDCVFDPFERDVDRDRAHLVLLMVCSSGDYLRARDVEVNTIPLLNLYVRLGSLACHPPLNREFSSGMQPQQAAWVLPFASNLPSPRSLMV